MKKIISTAVLSLTLIAAGQAHAAFGNDHLTQVFYTGGSNKIEIGVDLGLLGTDFSLTDQNKTLKSVDYQTIAAAADATAGELSMGMYIDSLINTTDAVWDHYFVTTTTTIPTTPNATRYSGLNTSATAVASYYNSLAGGDVVTASPAYTNSYRTKMDGNNASPGIYNGMNTAATPGELRLAEMTGAYTDLYLWHFSYDTNGGTTRVSHLVPGANTDYAAVLRFNSNGTTVLNPSAVPVPGAVWVLASGLTGLVGLRRRQDS